MAFGTYFGGWRIIHTLGTQGHQARSRSTASPPRQAPPRVIYGAGHFFGFPISTTQTITASIMGAGATRRLSAVRWGVAGNIAWAWILTLPAAALVAALVYLPLNLLL